MSSPSADATTTLLEAARGRKDAADQLLKLIYPELRALAESYLRRERAGHTLSATSLVHEAYLKLIEQSRAQWTDRAHFFALAAQAIRRILVDYARTRNREKRGGGAAPIELHPDAAATLNQNLDFVELHEALEKLAALSPRQADIVELRFFGGMSLDEIAEVLNTSPRTVDGDWAMARAWLKAQLRPR